MIPLVVAALLEKGLGMLGNAVLAKGQSVVEDKLGIKLTPDITPEQAVALKQLEFEHEKWLLDADIRRSQQALDETKIFLQDIASARGMQTAALAQEDLFVKRFVYYFSTVVFGFTALYIVGISFLDIPEKNTRTVDTILGFLLGTMLANIMGFFFGTTKSSQSKDAAINSMADTISKKELF